MKRLDLSDGGLSPSCSYEKQLVPEREAEAHAYFGFLLEQRQGTQDKEG